MKRLAKIKSHEGDYLWCLVKKEVKSLHETEVTLQVKIRISDDKKVTVGNLATAIRNLEIERRIRKEIITTTDENLVEIHCGSKYARGNGEQQYQRAGTSNREVITAVGKMNIKLHKVRDKESGCTFKPIKDLIDFNGQNAHQEDISMIAVGYVGQS